MSDHIKMPDFTKKQHNYLVCMHIILFHSLLNIKRLERNTVLQKILGSKMCQQRQRELYIIAIIATHQTPTREYKDCKKCIHLRLSYRVKCILVDTRYT